MVYRYTSMTKKTNLQCEFQLQQQIKCHMFTEHIRLLVRMHTVVIRTGEYSPYNQQAYVCHNNQLHHNQHQHQPTTRRPRPPPVNNNTNSITINLEQYNPHNQQTTTEQSTSPNKNTKNNATNKQLLNKQYYQTTG